MAESTDPKLPRDVRVFVQTYKDLNWWTLKIPPGEKGPREDGWQNKTFAVDDFAPDDNVGVMLGARSGGLVDVDIDHHAALIAADHFLPPTGAIFGRSGKRRSHRLYYAKDAKKVTKFAADAKTTLIELRAAHQTVFPGSVHTSGEAIEWEADRGPATVEEEPLLRLVALTAAATLVGLAWSDAAGQHHDAALALGGFLARCKVEPAAIERFVRAVCKIGRDEDEVDDRVRGARDSADKVFKGDEKVTGGPKLADILGADGEKIVARLRRWLGAEEEAEGIDAGEQDLAKVTTEAWDALVRANEPEPRLFRRDGAPVRVDRNDEGKTVLMPLDVDKLRHEAARATSWFTRRGKRVDKAMPPLAVMRDMLAQSEIPLPVVTRIVSSPIVAADGTIQIATGYSPATRTYYPPPGLSIPPVADAPTKADLARAVSLVRDDVMGDFPLLDDGERANAFAAFLLPFVRETFDGPTPLHLFEKPSVGTGATLLAKMLAFPALGDEPKILTQAESNEEWRKRVSSTLIAGPSVVLFDNVTVLDSDALAAALTSTTWADRVLGKTENLGVPVRCVWLATSNNAQISTEIMRRSVRIRLDARVDRPWERKPEGGFRHSDLKAWVVDRRGDLVWAALTVARAWIAAGRPHGKRTLGSFEGWSRTIGGMLDVAGVPGFLDNAENFYASSDVQGDAIRWFVGEWMTRRRFEAVTCADLRLFGLTDDSPLHMIIGGKTDKQLSANFGFFVRRLKDRVVTVDGGVRVRIESAGPSPNGAKYQLSRNLEPRI